MGCNMEYNKLPKPLYWMSFEKGKFTKRKFIEYQVRNPSFLRAEDGTVRQVTRYMEEKIGKYILLVDIQCMLMKILQRMKN